MSFEPVDSALAREYFKKQRGQSFFVLGGTFIIFVILFSWVASHMFADLFPFILGNALAGLIAYSAYLLWNKRPMQIWCLGCGEIISCRTPWVCGECRHENWDVGKRTILDECGNCHLVAKAYLCHHCDKPVFLSEDPDENNPAKRISTQGKEPKLRAEKQRESNEGFADQKTDLERDVEKAKLRLAKEQIDAQIEVVKKGLTLTESQMRTALDIKRESLRKFMDHKTATSEAAREEKALNAKDFKDNPTQRKKRDLWVDQWAREQLPEAE